MEIVKLRKELYAHWDELVNVCPNVCFYHDSLWFCLMEDVFGYRQNGFMIKEGGEFVGGVALFEIRTLMGGKYYSSSPFRDRGGIVYKDPKVLPKIIETVRELFEKDRRTITIKQMMAIPTNICVKAKVVEYKHWITTTVDLACGHEKLWEKLKNNAQGPVKQAMKKGLIVKVAYSKEDLMQFYKIFFATRKKIGIPVFPYYFFEYLWDHFFPKGKISLLLAELSGKPIAGIILLAHRDTVIDGYAASLENYRDYRGNDLLVWESIRWASENGYKIFDFGADSPLQKSLLAFKAKWKGIQANVNHYVVSSEGNFVPSLDSSDSKYSMGRKVLSHMPEYLYKTVSSFIVPGLG